MQQALKVIQVKKSVIPNLFSLYIVDKYKAVLKKPRNLNKSAKEEIDRNE